MPLAVVKSGALQGVSATPVDVEVNTGEGGEPRMILVGLPDAAVKESNDRVASALVNSGCRAPQTRSTINLAPGHIRKEGPLYDLPIAIGILASTGQLNVRNPSVLSDYLIAGELSLSGETRPVRGGLPLAIMARDAGLRGVLLPERSAREAALATGIEVHAVNSLDQARAFLEGRYESEPLTSPFADGSASAHVADYGVDFSEVKGQAGLRRAVEVAVAGAHNILMIGPPGSGKSMVAKRIPTIMPEPSLEEYLDILGVHSAAGRTIEEEDLHFRRPFRSPHHTISDVGLLGGGAVPGPGEISLAHNGVLFMDELPEFKRSVLEVLRQPLEDGEVTISRSAGKITIPSSFMLVAAMNPCPCGYLGDPRHECRCSITQIQRYRSRISGPLLDRIDIHVEAPALGIEELRDERPCESSATIRERISVALEIQRERFKGERAGFNSRMSHRHIRKYCQITKELGDLLQQAMEQLNLSARAYDRILKVSRTIADLAGSESILPNHLLEAIQFRALDRNLFY
ncbi:MAG: YifB family Mg chelatase-like AAA ATPase [Opitutales bacterium]|nr:YifB family Mg chelatase-like AAA ATPase [Opitutales bacterium]